MKTLNFVAALAASTAAALVIAFAPAAIAGPGHDHGHGHAHAAVGQQAPDFTLTDLDGNEHTLSSYTAEGKVVVLEWFNPDCPFVKKHHMVNRTMYETSHMASDNGVVWLAINSGKPGKQGTGHDRNVKAVEEYGIDYPVLLDESGSVGHTYAAKTTPHMYIIDETGTLIYAGAIDNDRSAKKAGDVNYVAQALGEHLEGHEVSEAETRPYGCSVKY